MKKIYTLLITLLIVILVGCSPSSQDILLDQLKRWDLPVLKENVLKAYFGDAGFDSVSTKVVVVKLTEKSLSLQDLKTKAKETKKFVFEYENFDGVKPLADLLIPADEKQVKEAEIYNYIIENGPYHGIKLSNSKSNNDEVTILVSDNVEKKIRVIIYSGRYWK